MSVCLRLTILICDIENAIRKLDKIKDCVVLTKSNIKSPEDRAIYSYFVSDEKLSILNVKNALREELPEYMIPTYLMQIDYIPMNHNGKLDRKALPDIVNTSEAEYIDPRNEMQADICSVFSEILCVAKLGHRETLQKKYAIVELAKMC